MQTGMEEIWLLASWIVDKWRRYNPMISKCVQVKMSFLLTNQRISSRNHTALDPGQFACWTHCRRIWWEEGWTGRLWKPWLVSPLIFFNQKTNPTWRTGVLHPIGWCTCSCPLGMWWFWLWIHQGFHWCQLSAWKLGSKFSSCQVLLQVNSSFFVVGRSEKFNTMRWYDTQYIALLLLLICNMVFLWSVESCAPHQQEHTTTPSIQKGSALN